MGDIWLYDQFHCMLNQTIKIYGYVDFLTKICIQLAVLCLFQKWCHTNSPCFGGRSADLLCFEEMVRIQTRCRLKVDQQNSFKIIPLCMPKHATSTKNWPFILGLSRPPTFFFKRPNTSSSYRFQIKIEKDVRNFHFSKMDHGKETI